MKFVLRYRPEVVADLDAGRRWYEERSAGLGSDLVIDRSEALARIQRNPEWVGVDAYGVRSFRIRRFPYVIHYCIEGEKVTTAPPSSADFQSNRDSIEESPYGIASPSCGKSVSLAEVDPLLSYVANANGRAVGSAFFSRLNFCNGIETFIRAPVAVSSDR